MSKNASRGGKMFYLLMCHQVVPSNSLYCTQKHYELPCIHMNVSVLNIHDRGASLVSGVVAFYGVFPFLLERRTGTLTHGCSDCSVVLLLPSDI